MVRGSFQLEAKIVQKRPTRRQDRQKSPEGPTRPLRTRFCVLKLECCSFSYFDHFFKDRPQDHSKCSKSLPKWPQDGHLGSNLEPSWLQLGPSWRPSWAMGARFWSFRGRPKSTKRASETTFMPRSPPDLDFHGFGIACLTFLVIFSETCLKDSEGAFGAFRYRAVQVPITLIQVLRNTHHGAHVR